MDSRYNDHERRIVELEGFVRLFKSSLSLQKPQQQQQQSLPEKSKAITTTGPRKGFYFWSDEVEGAKVLERRLKQRLNITNTVDAKQAQTAIYLNWISSGRIYGAEFLRKPEADNAPNQVIVLLIPGKNVIQLPDDMKNKRIIQFLLYDDWNLGTPFNSTQNQIFETLVRLASGGPLINSCIICDKKAATSCGNCGSMAYCGQKCADIHWENDHKEHCQ